jgi:hypothetical protein
VKDRIRELLHAVPFRPFVIRMVDGREFKIDHPEFVFAPPAKTPEVIVMEQQSERVHFVSTLLISRIETEFEDSQKRAV